METFIEIIKVLTPIGIGICGLLGVGSVGRIILKIMKYKNDEKIRKEKQTAIINSNFNFYMKLFDKIATNIKLCHTDKMTLMDFDEILGKSITAFNSENGYLDIDEQLKLTRPLQAREIY